MNWFKSAQKQKHVIDEVAFSIHDSDRYRTDKFDCYVSIIKSDTSIDIGLQLNNSQLGVASNVEYWHYPINELLKAKKTYYSVVKTAQTIISQFELEKPPFSLLGPAFRSHLRNIAPDYKDITGVYSINKNIKTPTEGDWRSSIYGTRYPNTPTIGNTIDGFFAEQKPYSVQKTDQKEISTQGNGRNKQLTLQNIEWKD